MIKKVTVPIYESVVYVCVGKTVEENRIKLENMFGPTDDLRNCVGLCSYSGNNFGLFFEEGKNLNLKVICHEVFHLTHRILEYNNTKFDSGHHEYAALLHEYLMDLVCGILKLKLKR